MSKPKDKIPQDKETKDKELKDKNNLVGRVRKVVKKSRRKLSEEKFEKELQRTIEFLEQMQAKLNNHQGDKAEKKVAMDAAKKTKTDKKAEKKATAKIAGKKSKSAGSKSKKTALVATISAAASPAQTQSAKK
jgi:hypothetical protein